MGRSVERPYLKGDRVTFCPKDNFVPPIEFSALVEYADRRGVMINITAGTSLRRRFVSHSELRHG